MHDLAIGERRFERRQRFADSGDPLGNLLRCCHRHIVFGEVDSGLEQRDQLYQLLFEGLQPMRERALELLRCYFGLVKRLRVDQVAHRFGLGQVEPAVQKSAHGELAGLGQTRAPATASSTMCRSTTGAPWADISTMSSVV